MRQLLLLFFSIAAGYGLWLLTRPQVRPEQMGLIKRHGLRLAAVALVLLALLVVAYFVPSTKLL